LFFSAPPPANLSAVPIPVEPDRYHGKRDEKIVKCTATRPNPAQRLSMASSDSLKACIRSINMISHPGHGCIIGLDSGVSPTIT
jgi:hypothetical protein